jgi:integrase/recombinase XerD
MREIGWERYPQVARFPMTKSWLQIQGNLGLAANTIAAYGRALEDYLTFCWQQQIEVATATRAHLSLYVHDLASRPNPRGANIRALDSGSGLANATLQQRLTAIRLFYDYLMEEGIRPTNPVGRGRYTPGKGFSGAREKGLIPRYRKLPWIPFRCCQKRGSRRSSRVTLLYSILCLRSFLCSLYQAGLHKGRGYGLLSHLPLPHASLK